MLFEGPARQSHDDPLNLNEHHREIQIFLITSLLFPTRRPRMKSWRGLLLVGSGVEGDVVEDPRWFWLLT